MNLTVVLVNYKCDKLKLQSCLNSIRIKTDVIIVDHSHDFTLKNIIVPQNLNIKVIKNINLGNGAGINCGIKNATTKLILYLDIDTVLSSNFFDILNKSINEIDSFAVVSPKINGFYKDENINKSGNLSLIKFYYNKLFFHINFEKKNLKILVKYFLLVVQ